MIFLANKNQSTVAFIHNNIIALPGNRVIGILLGHCVFGTDGQVLAKHFNHTLYSLDGKILAKDSMMIDKSDIDINKLLNDAWPLIMRIKDHTCPVIVPTETWAAKNVDDYFSSAG